MQPDVSYVEGFQIKIVHDDRKTPHRMEVKRKISVLSITDFRVYFASWWFLIKVTNFYICLQKRSFCKCMIQQGGVEEVTDRPCEGRSWK